MDPIKTDIVKSRLYKNKYYVYAFFVLYLGAIGYLFVLGDTYHTTVLTVVCYIIFVLGLFFLIREFIVKPKIVGNLRIDEQSLHFTFNEVKKQFDFSAIEQLTLYYTGYGSWMQYFWGNKNYLELESIDGERYRFEFCIKDRAQKNRLKHIFNSQPIKEQFVFKHLKNSRHQF